MSKFQGWQSAGGSLLVALALAACGGGSNNTTPPVAVTPTPVAPAPQEPNAPAVTNNIATDGLNWLNFRRSQSGMPVLARASLVDLAAQRHSDYQRVNNTVTHDQVAGNPGFTGVSLYDRLVQVGYATPTYFYGEVISASTSSSGVYLAEELITAIYHRFVIFEPRFKEIGAGAATSGAGYTYFTTNFTANNGYGPGIGAGNVATWPASGQSNVTRNFQSDFEEPDPVANQNEVGYPVSVHADANVSLTVTSFTMRPRGGSNLNVKLLSQANDEHTPQSAASIIPLAVLTANTTYDVSFTGTADGMPFTKTWSFTTKP